MKLSFISVIIAIGAPMAASAQPAKRDDQDDRRPWIAVQTPAWQTADLASQGRSEGWSKCSELPGAMANGNGLGTDCYVHGLMGNRLLAFDGSPSGELRSYFVLSQHPSGLGENSFSEQELRHFYYRRVRMLSESPTSYTTESKPSDLAAAAFRLQALSFRKSLLASFQLAAFRGTENRVKMPDDPATKVIRFPAEWIEPGTVRIADFFVEYLGKTRGSWSEVACKYVRQTGMNLNGYELALRMAASDYLADKLLDQPVAVDAVQEKLKRDKVGCSH